MNFSTIRTHLGHVQDSFTSLIHRFGISCTSQRCQVHPTGSNQSLDFINLGSQRVVRVLHISSKSFNSYYKPFTTRVREKGNGDKETSLHLDISSEEYWFARANRPYRLCDDCNRNPHPFKNNNLSEIHENFEPGYTTDGSNQMTVQDSGPFRIVSKSSFKLIDSYAETLSREVIDQVFRCMANKCQTSGYSALKDTPLGNISTEDSYNELEHSDENVINYEPIVNTEILNTHLSSVKESTDVNVPERSCQKLEDKIRDTAFGTCSSGFVNFSFSGSLSEPDEIISSYIDNRKVFDASSMGSTPIQYKFEASNSFKERLFEYDSEVSTISLDARKKLSDGGAEPCHGLEEKPENEPDQVTDKSSIAKDDSGRESTLKIDHISELINKMNTGPLNVNDPKNHQVLHDNGRISHDSCVHTQNTQKPLLLFLHGVGSSADVWSVVLEYFSAAGYEVLAPDMLGHGYSSAPDNRAAYTFDRLLQDVLQIFDRFVSDNQKCVAIGHSYGSCFAAALARYRPQQISQLVLLSSGGPSPLVPRQSLFSLHPCVVSLMKPFLMCGFKRDVFYAPRGKHLPSFCTYELPPYVMNHVERGQEWSDGDSAFHRRILVPTLLVHGLKDPYISLVEECEMERTIPRSFLEVLPNAGHMQMLDAPEQLCHMIHCFITWWNS